MGKPKINERVGAILSADKNEVRLFGYGVYQGDKVSPKGRPSPAGFLAEAERPNPEILLDSGETVYGCECWWGPEDVVKQKIGEWTERIVSISDELKVALP